MRRCGVRCPQRRDTVSFARRALLCDEPEQRLLSSHHLLSCRLHTQYPRQYGGGHEVRRVYQSATLLGDAHGARERADLLFATARRTYSKREHLRSQRAAAAATLAHLPRVQHLPRTIKRRQQPVEPQTGNLYAADATHRYPLHTRARRALLRRPPVSLTQIPHTARKIGIGQYGAAARLQGYHKESRLPHHQHRQKHKGNLRLSQLPQRLCLRHILQEAGGRLANQLSRAVCTIAQTKKKT